MLFYVFAAGRRAVHKCSDGGCRMSEANLDHPGTRAVPAFLTAAARRLLNWLAWLVLLAIAVMVWRAAAR